MECRICGVFLNPAATAALLAGLLLPGSSIQAASDSAGSDNTPADQVVRPEIQRREVREADIDTEDFEIGVFAGAMSVEDFGTNFVWGGRLAYHVTEYVFVEGAYGRTNTDKTSFERLSGSARVVNDRTLQYYNISFGVNILPGESFILDRWAFKTDFYLIGGVGSTNFNNEDEFTWNYGAGYKILITDWMSLRVDVRDHVFDIDLLGESNTTHNLEFTGGVSIFF
jgi:outer membrane beta-barrel protein